jgi:pimeloyl-ACP methyl ester carboxylesterase
MDYPIVFIHGSGDSARIWRLQVEELGKDRQVFAYRSTRAWRETRFNARYYHCT